MCHKKKKTNPKVESSNLDKHLANFGHVESKYVVFYQVNFRCAAELKQVQIFTRSPLRLASPESGTDTTLTQALRKTDLCGILAGRCCLNNRELPNTAR